MKSLKKVCWNKDGESGLCSGHAAQPRSKADALGR